MDKKNKSIFVVAIITVLLFCSSCESQKTLLTLENKEDYTSGVHKKEEVFQYFQEHRSELDLMMERFKKYDGEKVDIRIGKSAGIIQINATSDGENISSKISKDRKLLKACKVFLESDFIRYIDYDNTDVNRAFSGSIDVSFNDPEENESVHFYNSRLYYYANVLTAPDSYEHVTGNWWYRWSPGV
jgi:hypothetical protein